MRQISILGCGWLGLPLAQALLAQAFLVKGSTTSESKINSLKLIGINPYLISLTPENIQGNIHDFLSGSEILIVDIPPKLRGLEKENFVAKIENLIPFIEDSGVKKVLFVSSTAVYAEDNCIVTETTNPHPATESGSQLLLAETLLQNNSHFETTILRFGGLVGENRHPVHYLAGKNNVDNPDAPINLIHQEDCIGIMLQIILRDSWPEVFNAAAPFHPLRKNYYTEKSLSLGLHPPNFTTGISVGKTIDSSKVLSILNYTFIHTDTI